MRDYNFSNVGYDGSVFTDFYVAKDPCHGPGWFIFGRNKVKYGVHADGSGAYVKNCAYRYARHHRHYNGRVNHGWMRKRDAQAVADQLNKESAQ